MTMSLRVWQYGRLGSVGSRCVSCEGFVGLVSFVDIVHHDTQMSPEKQFAV
jgi:hypothetical protein